MRFWPFGKRQRAATDEAPPTAAAPSPVAAAEPAPARPPTGAWRHLPALRPTTASLSLTAPVQRLTDTLTSTQRPQVASSKLGHARTFGGPTGSVAGLVRPHRVVHGDGGAAPLTFVHAPDPVEASEAVPIRPWATPQRLPATTPSPPVAATVNAPSTDAIPSSPTVSGSSVVERPAAMPSLPARTMPVRSITSVAVEPVVASPPPTVAPVVQRLAESTSTATSSAPASPSIERSIVEASAPTRPDAPTLGSTRIVRRVGAPLHSRPPSMVDAVEPAAAPEITQSAQRLPVAAASGNPIDAPSPPTPTVVPSAPGGLPSLPARAMASVTQPSVPTRSAPTPNTSNDAPIVGSAPSIQRLPGTAPSMTIPKLSSPDDSTGGAADVVPVRRGVQRAPESVPPTVRSELEPVLGDSLADVKVHRGPETGAAARAIQAKAFTTGGAVYMPDEIGSTALGEGRKILAHELTHVVQQRALGGSLPGEDSAEGARLESEARVVGGQDPVPTRAVSPTTRPAAAGPAQRLAGSPIPHIVRPLTPASGAGPAAGERSAVPPASQMAIVATVQAAAARAGVPSVASTHGSHGGAVAPTPAATTAQVPAVQRMAGVTAQAPREASVASAPPGPVASDVSATERSPEGSHTDMEDLARQLYPKFRNRLRNDLLADRERSGRLFDR